MTPSNFWLKGYFCLFLVKLLFIRPLFFIRRFHSTFFNEDFIFGDWVIVDCRIFPNNIGEFLDAIVFLIWFCEKMKINIQIMHSPGRIQEQFENDTLINMTYEQKQIPNLSYRHVIMSYDYWGKFFLLSECGAKMLSKLSIKREICESSDQWFDKHIKGDWVAVHYRGTDVRAGTEVCYGRYGVETDHYINYLKEVLDKRSSIFVCSDQMQFIDQMHDAFPGRVFARDIRRSFDERALHSNVEYRGAQQIKDALADILILAKAKLVFTTGSNFIYVVRFFNPKIKIVSLDGRRPMRSKNIIPIPRKDLYKKLYFPYLNRSRMSRKRN